MRLIYFKWKKNQIRRRYELIGKNSHQRGENCSQEKNQYLLFFSECVTLYYNKYENIYENNNLNHFRDYVLITCF